MKTLYPIVAVLLTILSISGCQATPKPLNNSGNAENPIIDSNMSLAEALAGVDADCLAAVCKTQVLVTVKYYAFDQKIHQGQLVIDRELEADMKTIFAFALEKHFPIQSVIPISDLRFRKHHRWDDNLSMAANNTSAFNYRLSTGSRQLSKHAYGRAIDMNPLLNPYIKGAITSPSGATYLPNKPGTFTADHPLVQKFLQLGWQWGGNWKTLKDYQHFEK